MGRRLRETGGEERGGWEGSWWKEGWGYSRGLGEVGMAQGFKSQLQPMLRKQLYQPGPGVDTHSPGPGAVGLR